MSMRTGVRRSSVLSPFCQEQWHRSPGRFSVDGVFFFRDVDSGWPTTAIGLGYNGRRLACNRRRVAFRGRQVKRPLRSLFAPLDTGPTTRRPPVGFVFWIRPTRCRTLGLPHPTPVPHPLPLSAAKAPLLSFSTLLPPLPAPPRPCAPQSLPPPPPAHAASPLPPSTPAQVRDPDFTSGSAQWALHVSSGVVSASVDWKAGQPGITITIHRNGAGAAFLNVSQWGLLLCERYRYNVTATLRSLKSQGQATLTVNGGRENGYADLLARPLTAGLDSDRVTLTDVFEVTRRWSTAEVALAFTHPGNDDNVLEIESVSVCPVPSRRQYCEAGPRQTPATPTEMLRQGDVRVTATHQHTGASAFGIASFVRRRMPPYSAAIVAARDASSRPHGRAYFWPEPAPGGLWAVDYVVVHNSEWYGHGTRVQAIALHQLKVSGLCAVPAADPPTPTKQPFQNWPSSRCLILAQLCAVHT